MARTSKKLKAAYEAVDRNKAYALAEAVALVKSHASSKFDETIEIAILYFFLFLEHLYPTKEK